MKIKTVAWNNRKKSLTFETTRGNMELPYSKLRLKPSIENPIVRAYGDPELGMQGFTYHLVNGQEDTLPANALLEYNGDLSYWRQMTLYKMTLQANDLIKHSHTPKRELCRRLKTSPAHLYRLLDTAFYGKTIDQMLLLLAALDCKVEFAFKKVA